LGFWSADVAQDNGDAQAIPKARLWLVRVRRQSHQQQRVEAEALHMLLATISLVILFSGGADGGRAISTDLRFTDMAVCEAAAERISKLSSRGLTAVCVNTR
jgi:hypothetical protein